MHCWEIIFGRFFSKKKKHYMWCVKLPKIEGPKDVVIYEILKNCEEKWPEKKEQRAVRPPF